MEASTVEVDALRRRLLGAVAVAATIAAPSLTSAQAFPERAVRFIVPMAPGGGADIAIRALAAKLQPLWSGGTIVDNRAGGTGAIGLSAAKISRPDGYTLVLCTASHAALQATRPDSPYDLLRDFEAITQITTAPYVLVVHPAVKARSVQELVTLSREQPKGLTYSSAGHGSMQHLAGALLAARSKANLLHVPYKGGGPALADVIAGQIDMVFATPQEAAPQVAAGRLRAVAVTGSMRLPGLPSTPTVAESGFSGFSVVQWYGLLAPAGTPPEIVARLHKDIVAAVRSPDIVARFAKEGVEVVTSSPEAFKSFVSSEVQRYKQETEYASVKSE